MPRRTIAIIAAAAALAVFAADILAQKTPLPASYKKWMDEEGVYIVESGRVKFVPVAKGITGGMLIEAASGLAEGQEIVTGPYASLRDLKDGVLIKTEAKKDAAAK